jgi:type 1 glutamine amidotransferase
VERISNHPALRLAVVSLLAIACSDGHTTIGSPKASPGGASSFAGDFASGNGPNNNGGIGGATVVAGSSVAGDGGSSGALLGGAGGVSTGGSGTEMGPVNVLVFNYTSGYGHQSRETAIPVLQAAAAADTTEPKINLDVKYALTAVLPEGTNDASMGLQPDYSAFVQGGLDKYDVVLFLNTTGAPLGADGMEKVHEQALQDYMEKTHGGFVGTHSATDTYQANGGDPWPWYVSDLLGANFSQHSNYPTQGTARYNEGLTAANNAILRNGEVPNPWQRSEEWYSFTPADVGQAQPADGSGVFTVLLLGNDNHPELGGERPTAWVNQMTGGGRVFYSAFGHDVSAFEEPAFQKFFFAGIRWAAHRL